MVICSDLLQNMEAVRTWLSGWEKRDGNSHNGSLILNWLVWTIATTTALVCSKCHIRTLHSGKLFKSQPLKTLKPCNKKFTWMAARQISSVLTTAHHLSLGNTNCKVSSAFKSCAEEGLQPIKPVLCTHYCDPNRKVEVMAKLIKVNYALFDTFHLQKWWLNNKK